MKIATVVGARPQFVKAAMLSREIRRRREAGEPSVREVLVHTGQHFDDAMSEVFFRELDLPHPDYHLGVAGGGHGLMTGRMLERIEEVLLAIVPDRVVVYGDTNSTLAGALAAAKLGVPAAHVEAGLRSFNRRMPEEINRIVADHVADLLLAPTAAAVENLLREGIPPQRIVNSGDIMYDAMLWCRARAAGRSDGAAARLELRPRGYVLATVHRAENTDDGQRLRSIMEGLARVALRLPVVLPLHPRTRRALERIGHRPPAGGALRLIEPLGYLDTVELEASAALIATDSGGMQKEAYFNAVPCLTLRGETEWVELVEAGANILVGTDPDAILAGFERALGMRVTDQGLYGDGRAASTILDAIMRA